MRTFGPYPGTVISIHDGDTLAIDLDLGAEMLVSGHAVHMRAVVGP